LGDRHHPAGCSCYGSRALAPIAALAQRSIVANSSGVVTVGVNGIVAEKVGNGVELVLVGTAVCGH
jgi:hypothetical protein